MSRRDNDYEEQFRKKLYAILASGEKRQTRNALTHSVFAHSFTLDDLERNVFPLLRARKLYWKAVVGELAAFLKGPKTIKDFESQGCNYWKDWGKKDGTIDIDYGNTWLDFDGVNQLENVVQSLKTAPAGRRHLITGWRPPSLTSVDLPCCHYAYQWYVRDGNILDMIWVQRSVDYMIGLPSDVILAAAWNILMAQTCGYRPGRLTFQLGDVHIYESHIEGVRAYLDAYDGIYNAASWTLDPEATVFNFKPEMLQITDYDSCPAIKFKLEV